MSVGFVVEVVALLQAYSLGIIVQPPMEGRAYLVEVPWGSALLHCAGSRDLRGDQGAKIAHPYYC